MKCKYCDKRISKKDEICPRCGKYVAEPDEEVLEDSEPERELGKNVKFFECKSFAGDILLYGGGIGLLMTAANGYFIYKRSYILGLLFNGHISRFLLANIILCVIGLIVLIFSLIAFFATRKSFVCVNENGVYGIRPKLFLKPERFEFFYEDITDFSCRIPVKDGIPYIKVEANGKTFRIYGLRNSDASFLASYVRENMPLKRKRR